MTTKNISTIGSFQPVDPCAQDKAASVEQKTGFELAGHYAMRAVSTAPNKPGQMRSCFICDGSFSTRPCNLHFAFPQVQMRQRLSCMHPSRPNTMMLELYTRSIPSGTKNNR